MPFLHIYGDTLHGYLAASGGSTYRTDSLGSLASLMRLYFLASGWPVVDSAGARADSLARVKWVRGVNINNAKNADSLNHKGPGHWLDTTATAQTKWGNFTLYSLSPNFRLSDNRNITWAGNETLGTYQFYTNDASTGGAHIIGGIDLINDYIGAITTPNTALRFFTYNVLDGRALSEKFRITSSGICSTGTGGKLYSRWAQLDSLWNVRREQIIPTVGDASNYALYVATTDIANGKVALFGVMGQTNGMVIRQSSAGGANMVYEMNAGKLHVNGDSPDSTLTVTGSGNFTTNLRVQGNLTAPTATFGTSCTTGRLAAVHTVSWGGYTGTGWDSTWHRWGRRDSVDSLEASLYFKAPYLGSFGTPLLNLSGEFKINKSGAWYLGSGAVTRLLDQSDFLSPRDSVHSGYIYSDTAGNRPGVIAGDTILGNARQNKYTFYGLEVQGDTIDSWQFPGSDTIVIYRIDVWMITPPSDHPGTDCDTIVLKGSDSIKVALPKSQQRVVWTGRTLYKAGTNTSWVCRSVQSVGAADVSITLWFYPHAKGPGGTPWKGLASVIHPALGYALAILALGGAALAKFKRFKKGKHETPDSGDSINA
jgi:hypothetical protein